MLEFGILGSLVVRGPGGELPVPGPKRRSLLVRLLVSADEVVSAERLAEDLWDGSPPDAAQSTLQSHISYLRRTLGSNHIRRVGVGYVIDLSDATVDARLFETEVGEGQSALAAGEVTFAESVLRDALARWRGPALTDVAAADWAVPEASRLEELRLGATEAWHEVLLIQGRHGDVVASTEAAVPAYPTRERLWAQMMLGLYRSGRQADALRAFQRLRGLLGEELGLDPSPELMRLEEAILQQRPELDWVPPDGSVDPGGRAPKLESNSALPSGDLTLLLTHIENSVRLWDASPADMAEALPRHDQLVCTAIDSGGGYVFKTVNGSVMAVFADAGRALQSAIQAQRRLRAEPWPANTPIRVRMALHTGRCEERDGGYEGPTVNRAGRVLALAHGGQMLMSMATAEIVRDSLPGDVTARDLGEHRLKDLGRPERVFQIEVADLETEFPPLRSLDDPLLRHNLPHQLSSFIGRTREVGDLAALVRSQRLVTVTGVGGVGKTRLALQVAADFLAETSDEVWFIELASLSDPEAIARNVARVLGVPQHSDRPMTETVVTHLRDRRLLLVLDNCEHVLTHVARLVAQIVQSCPHVRILATSRELLGVAGETMVRLSPMPTPPIDVTTIEDISAFESVQLFSERARSQEPGFLLSRDNCLQVASICRRLDGIPLAIELAATRLRSMTVADIDDRLDRRFSLLTGGDRSRVERQQTLQATVDWSYDLLSPVEKWVFERLSVFGGAWNLAAARAVCARNDLDPWAIEDQIGSLVDKSLLQLEVTSGGLRYRFLETIRFYASERLARTAEPGVSSAQHAHASFYLDAVEEAAPHLTDVDQVEWVAKLEGDHDDLQAAMKYLMERSSDTELALRLAVGLRWFWFVKGYYEEGIGFLDAILSRPDADSTSALVAAALLTAGTLQQARGELERASLALERSHAIAEERDLVALDADVVCEMAWLAFQRNERQRAVELANEALAKARETDQPKLIGFALSVRGGATFGEDQRRARQDFEDAIQTLERSGDRKRLSGTLCRLAIHEFEVEDLDGACGHFQQVRALAMELNDEGMLPFVNFGLGFCTLFGSGDSSAARAFFGDALSLAIRVDDPGSIAYAVFGLAFCAAADEHPLAAVLHGAADALLRATGQDLEPYELSLRDHDYERLRGRLGASEFESAYATGMKLERETIVEMGSEYAWNKQDEWPGANRTQTDG